MGCYDTIFLKIKCPYCGKTCEDGQTKDLSRSFFDYGKENMIPTSLKTICVTYQCYECNEIFDIEVKIKKSKLTTSFEYTDLDYSKIPFNPSRRIK